MQPTPDTAVLGERFTIEPELPSPLSDPTIFAKGGELAKASPSVSPRSTIACETGDVDLVSIQVFDDFLCPHCEQQFLDVIFPLHQTDQLKPDEVAIEFIALPVHGQPSRKLAEAAHCAEKLVDPWIFRQWLYDSENKTLEQAEAIVSKLGGDIENYQTCLNAQDTAEQVQAGIELAQNLEILATPTIKIVNHTLIGKVPQENIAYEIRKALAKRATESLECKR